MDCGLSKQGEGQEVLLGGAVISVPSGLGISILEVVETMETAGGL